MILSMLDALGRQVGGIFDDSPDKHGTRIAPGHPIVAPRPTDPSSIDGVVLLAIGSNLTRQHFAALWQGQVSWCEAIVHPSAVVDASVQMSHGTVVFAGAVVQTGTRLGHHAIVNTSASVDHDSRIGDFVHLTPGVHLAGDVTVEEGGFLGVGACVVPGKRIGSWSSIGAGGVVIRDIPDAVTAVGVPARALTRSNTHG